MPKAKVGDRIRIVNALMSMGEYTEGDEGKITALCHEDPEDVMVSFDHYEEGEGSMYVLGEEYEVISSEEEHPGKTGDVPKIGGVPKAGDKVRLVNKPIWVGAYKEGDTGVVVDQWGAAFGYLLVALDNGIYSIPHGQYEVIENDAETSFPERKEEHRPNKDAPASSAEAIRDNILRIREKRNDLKMEIIALDKEEADCVEKLKNLGFVLHEEASSGASKEEKTVLYAEDIAADMDDPKNWKIGDLIECDGVPDTTPGKGYRIVSLSMEDNEVIFIDDVGDKQYRDIDSRFKFHSRPL